MAISPPAGGSGHLTPPNDDQLNVLLAEYQSGREDDRHSLTQQVVLVGASAAALVAALAQGPDLSAVDDRAKFLLMMVGLAFGCYAAIFFANATIRHVYLRLIEDAIAAKVKGIDLPAFLAWDDGQKRPELRTPALAQLGRAVHGRRYGSRRIKIISAFFFSAMLAGLGGAVYATVWTIDNHRLKIVALAIVTVYSLFAVAVMWTTGLNVDAFVRRRFVVAARARQDSQQLGQSLEGFRLPEDARQTANAKERSLLGYLLLPRLPEAFKATYFLIAAGVGLLLYPAGSPSLLLAIAIMWVALEPLAYQARYTWNDLRDVAEDGSHSAKVLRGRIPVKEDENDSHLLLGAVALMMVFRLVLAVALVALLVPAPLKTAGLTILALLAVQAIGYETLRTATKSRAGRKRPGVIEWLVYLVVGLGYGLRAGAGVYFGSAGLAAPELLWLMVGTFSLLGTANCMTIWLLEVSTGADPQNPKELRPSGALSSKSHVWSLSRFYPRLHWRGIDLMLSRQSEELRRLMEPSPAPLSSVAVLAPRDVLGFPGLWAYALALAMSSQLGLVLYRLAAGTDVPAIAAFVGGRPEVVGSGAADGGPLPLIAGGLVGMSAVVLLAVLALIPTNAGWLVGLGVPMVVAVSTAAPTMDPRLLIPLAPILFVIVVYMVTRSSSYEANASGWTSSVTGLLRLMDYGAMTLAQHALRDASFTAVFKHGAKRFARARVRLQRKYRDRLWPRQATQFALCSAALWAGFMGPQLVLLPVQIQNVAGVGKAAELGPILAAGAVTAIIANLCAGAVSDFLRVKANATRRPLIMIGAAGGSGAMLLLSQAATLADLWIGWIVMQLFLNIMLSGVVALIPDHVRPEQRGFISGLFSAMQIGGAVLGGGLAVALPPTNAYFGIAALLFFLPWPLVLGWRATQLPRLEVGKDTVRTSSRRNLGWAYATRFTVQFAITLGTAYLLFYLADNTSEVPPKLGLIILTGVLGLAMASTGLVVGSDSDKRPADDLLQKRKPYILAAGFVVAAGALILAFVPTWPATTTAAAVIGVGFGLFATADLALNTQVLTSPRLYATQLGLLNIANTLPQVFGALVTASVVTLWGYAWLYIATAAAAMIGCLFILFVKADPPVSLA